jgi:acyl-coenzyme A thioesterase PaaI-like protein
MTRQPQLSAAELNRHLDDTFTESRPYRVVEVWPDHASVQLDASDVAIRPGGTVSGPTVMGLADAAAWLVVLAHTGWVPLAVTSSLSINFLRKPEPGDLLATAELL